MSKRIDDIVELDNDLLAFSDGVEVVSDSDEGRCRRTNLTQDVVTEYILLSDSRHNRMTSEARERVEILSHWKHD